MLDNNCATVMTAAIMSHDLDVSFIFFTFLSFLLFS